MRGDAPTVAEFLRRQARSRADHPLLVCDGDRISYGEAEARSAELARGLIAVGAGKGTHVGLLYPNGPEFVVAMLAAARIGAVVVPFSTFMTARELREQLVDSDTEILLATASFRSHDYVRRLADVLSHAELDSDERLFVTAAPQLRHVIVDPERGCRRTRTVDPGLLEAMEEDVDGCDPLAIVYTSGSTSAPKGVVHTHGALLAHQQNLNEIRGLTADDKLFCNSPFFWIGGFAFGLLATLVAGSTLMCSNATDAGADAGPAGSRKTHHDQRFRRRHRSSGAITRASRARPVVDASGQPVSDHGARAPDRPTRSCGTTCSGMTEAGSVVLISGDESDQPESRRGSFGKPAPGFETMIVDRRRVGRRRAVHPRAVCDAGVLQAQSRRVLRRRRLVPHRRFGAHRRPTVSSTTSAGSAR